MDQKQFDAVLSDAEARLRRLKVLYEQWFVGIERVEPAQARKEFADLLARMRKEQTSNTAQRFRLQQLVQRHITLSTHWRRIGRQIEDGTYQRDLLRAKRRKQQVQARGSAEPELDVSYDVDIDDDLAEALAEADRLAGQPPAPRDVPAAVSAQLPTAPTQPTMPMKLPLGAAGSTRTGVVSPERGGGAAQTFSPFAMPAADGQRVKPPPAPKGPPPPPPPLLKQPLAKTPGAAPGPPPPRPSLRAQPAVTATTRLPGADARPAAASRAGFSAQDVDRVYKQYIAARSRNAERTDNVKRETIERTIRGMLPQLERKHAGKRIDFEVVVKHGRVALKPVAK